MGDIGITSSRSPGKSCPRPTAAEVRDYFGPNGRALTAEKLERLETEQLIKITKDREEEWRYLRVCWAEVLAMMHGLVKIEQLEQLLGACRLPDREGDPERSSL